MKGSWELITRKSRLEGGLITLLTSESGHRLLSWLDCLNAAQSGDWDGIAGCEDFILVCNGQAQGTRVRVGAWGGVFKDKEWVDGSFPVKVIDYPENHKSPREQVAEVMYWVDWALDQEHPILIATHSTFVLCTLVNCQLKDKLDRLEHWRDTYRFYCIEEDGKFRDMAGEDGLVSKNPMNGCMGELLEEQYRILREGNR